MIVVSVIGWVLLVAAAVIIAYAFLREFGSRSRAWERKEAAWTAERKELLDRIMYLADRPWEVPQDAVEDEPDVHPDDIPYDPLMRPIEDFDYHSSPSGVV